MTKKRNVFKMASITSIQYVGLEQVDYSRFEINFTFLIFICCNLLMLEYIKYLKCLYSFLDF